MAHFAKVVNGRVVNVIVAADDFLDTFVDDSPGEWVQTSFNTHGGTHYTINDDGSLGAASADQTQALRYNYAAIDDIYDSAADAFYAPAPYSSWVLDTTTYLWEPPTQPPDDGVYRTWREETETWAEVT